MKELIAEIKELKEKIAKTWQMLGLDETKKEIGKLEKEMARPDFWQVQEKAKKTGEKLKTLKDEVACWEKVGQEVKDLLELTQIAEKEEDESLKGDIEARLGKLNKQFQELEFFVLFSGKYDRNNAIMAIHAGTGGTEAQDWVEMLLRMFLRFCEKRGFQARIVDESRGQEAGIKSVTVDIQGRWAYGWLKSEAGVHRLVRISPFDAEKMRHTSFALVEVLPELPEAEEVKIDAQDLKIDVFRASGHGGQSVQKTESAVRLTHLPTGLVVSCQNERSQLQNKETALKILKSKLHKLYLEAKTEEKQKIRGEYAEAAWGNQIRSYVLHPYKMVKDHRTKYETKDPEAALDGGLEGFVEAYLKWDKAKSLK